MTEEWTAYPAAYLIVHDDEIQHVRDDGGGALNLARIVRSRRAGGVVTIHYAPYEQHNRTRDARDYRATLSESTLLATVHSPWRRGSSRRFQ